MSRIFFFGFGYTASFLARRLREEGWEMAGTTRSADKVNQMWEQGVEPHIWTGEGPMEAPMRIMEGVTHILHSVPPGPKGDPVMINHQKLLAQIAPQLSWYGYISTVSVYGDTQGEVAKEDFEPNPSLQRGKMRLRVERTHRQLSKKSGLPLHIFRAGAIYGPRRSALMRAAGGKAQIIHKEGHETSRIYVEDFAQVLYASIKQPNPGAIYNVVDDLPTGPEVPLEHAYDMLGKPKPPVVEYKDVQEDMPPALNAYYAETRHVSNDRIKSELGVKLQYPTYKEGYEAIYEYRKARAAKPAASGPLGSSD